MVPPRRNSFKPASGRCRREPECVRSMCKSLDMYRKQNSPVNPLVSFCVTTATNEIWCSSSDSSAEARSPMKVCAPTGPRISTVIHQSHCTIPVPGGKRGGVPHPAQRTTSKTLSRRGSAAINSAHCGVSNGQTRVQPTGIFHHSNQIGILHFGQPHHPGRNGPLQNKARRGITPALFLLRSPVRTQNHGEEKTADHFRMYAHVHNTSVSLSTKG